LMVLITAGCAQNPASGRPEVTLVSAEKERKIGAEMASKVEKSVGLVEDPEILAYVRAVGSRLATHSPRRDVEYIFHVVNMAEPNAFALPGGYIYVSRGLLALVNSEDELAGVIAHEVAHVAARHAVQRVNVQAATAPMRIASGITGLAILIVAPRLGAMVAGVGQVASGLVLAPYSRDQEREADRIGQELAASTGWEPDGLTSFLDTLGREEALRVEGPRRNSFFATHPSTPDRVIRTAQHAARLTPVSAIPIATDRADLLARLDGLLVGTSASEGVLHEGQFLQPDLDFTVQLPPKWSAQNTRTVVGAQAANEDALVLLHVAGKGEDPLEIVRALDQKLKASLLENAKRTEINGLRAVRSVSAVRGSKGVIGLDLTWITHRGLIYQITGMSPIDQFDGYQRIFSETAGSFRPLTTAERSQIREARLRIVRGRSGETLVLLTERTDSAWTPGEVAVANGIESDVRLQDGDLIKVPMLEPYVSPARPAALSD
jgi:predicted Zn-dependent protease